MVADAGIILSETRSLTPIDDIETFVLATDWSYERYNSNEIIIGYKGQHCEYQISANWVEYNKILHLSFAFSVGLSKEPMNIKREHSLLKLLGMMNETLQLGHFDLWREENAIIWRHAQILENKNLSIDTVAYLFRLAIDICERNYPAFQFLLWAGHDPFEALQFVLFETVGQA